MATRHDPNGPKTMDMFPAMTRQPRHREEPELTITCPRCGSHRPISRREWLRTQQVRLKEFREWNAKEQVWRKWRETDPDSGPNAPLPCLTCGASPTAAEWHRTYEREQLAAKGIATPRLQRERTAS